MYPAGVEPIPGIANEIQRRSAIELICLTLFKTFNELICDMTCIKFVMFDVFMQSSEYRSR